MCNERDLWRGRLRGKGIAGGHVDLLGNRLRAVKWDYEKRGGVVWRVRRIAGKKKYGKSTRLSKDRLRGMKMIYWETDCGKLDCFLVELDCGGTNQLWRKKKRQKCGRSIGIQKKI